jgi:hypothetical protein
MRESIRRLEEIRAILDGRHKTHLQRHRDDDSAKPPVKERFKRFFSGQRPEEEPDDTPQLVDGPRVLDTVSEGDQLKVLECEGPWLKIKTREGRTGWVYSTLQPQR